MRPPAGRVRPQVVVIGLDCLTPQLLFDRWLDELPTFRALVGGGVHGRLRSVDPPITVPAWSCMMSGYDAAQLGVYGFRHRRLGSYSDRYFAYDTSIKRPRVWDHLSQAGRTVGLLAIPQTHPPRAINGWSVSGFLAGSTAERYTWPASLADEVRRIVGDYRLDVADFRTEERDRVLREVQDMTEQRFELFRHFLENRPADFMMMVEIGPDRMHHAFWRWTDPAARGHDPSHRYAAAIRDYYRMLDDRLRGIIERLDDRTHLFVVSDHGAKAMMGGICLNELFRRHGLLVLKEEPPTARPLREEMIDFTRTRCWGWGGYYGRVFLNLEGREPQGIVPAEAREEVREEVAWILKQVRDPDGRPLRNVVFRPEDIHADPRGDYPDLMVYFDELRWRSVGSVGVGSVHTLENDTGPDDANHAEHGVFLYGGPHARHSLRRDDLRLLDVGPTILSLFGLPVPPDAAGRTLEI